MSRVTNVSSKLLYFYRKHMKWIIAACVLIVVTLYVVLFVIERHVTFSYGGPTCTRAVTLLPSLHKTASSEFDIAYGNELKVGNISLVATRLCFTPQMTPKSGVARASIAPFGGFIARQSFALQVAKVPTATIATSENPIAVTKPLVVRLSAPDAVHRYTIATGTTSAPCKSADSALRCDIPRLKLEQGKEYQVALTRQFNQEPATEADKATVKTLTAVNITKTSVKNKATIYAKPQSFTITTDKQLRTADATLKPAGKNQKSLKTNLQIDGKTATITLDKQLKRSAKYTLQFTKAEAINGSTLTDPYTIRFFVSGGPKITGISINKTRVAQSATAVITFDQALTTKQDITKFVQLRGGSAIVRKLSSKQVSVSLQGLPKCKSFTLSVQRGLESKYEIAASEPWQYAARTICHSVGTIGASRNGRPISAYYFGSTGPVTLFVGALHGNEVSSSLILQDWINELEANPGRIPKDSRVVIIPSANPDGVAANTRNNAKNVNINRNFPTDDWKKDIDDTNGRVRGGGGSKPLSEPESKALSNITSSLRPRLLLSYHAVGSLVVGDPGGYSARYAANYASRVGYRNATGQSGTFDYNITGAYEDWSYRKVGVPSMVIELGSYTFRDFSHHREAFWAMLQ